MSEVAMAVSEEELLNRLDQMAMEIENLRQQVLESMAAKRRRKKLSRCGSMRLVECGPTAQSGKDYPPKEFLNASVNRLGEAPTALVENAVLVTSNVRHFSMIDGLRLEKPY